MNGSLAVSQYCGLVGESDSPLTLQNVTSNVSVQADGDWASLLVGNNLGVLLITNCQVSGVIDASMNAGTIAVAVTYAVTFTNTTISI